MPRALLLAAGMIVAGAARLAAQAPDAQQGGFLLRRGDDTLVAEGFTRTDGLLEGRLLALKRLPVTYRAVLAGDATVERLEVAALQPGAPAEAPPRQVGVLQFRGDSVLGETRTGDSTRIERFESRAGALPYHAQVPVFLLSGGARTAGAWRWWG